MCVYDCACMCVSRFIHFFFFHLLKLENGGGDLLYELTT